MVNGSAQKRRERAGVAFHGDHGLNASELAVVGGYELVEEQGVCRALALGAPVMVAGEDGDARVVAGRFYREGREWPAAGGPCRAVSFGGASGQDPPPSGIARGGEHRRTWPRRCRACEAWKLGGVSLDFRRTCPTLSSLIPHRIHDFSTTRCLKRHFLMKYHNELIVKTM